MKANDALPPKLAHQATCVMIGDRGLLIEGPPGSGKSSLALALIDRGGARYGREDVVLVGDDSVVLEAADGVLVACPHPNTRGLLEVRNLGLLRFPVAEAAPIALLVTLDRDAPRYIEQAGTTERAGIPLPHVRLWPDTPLLPLRAELALAHYGRR